MLKKIVIVLSMMFYMANTFAQRHEVSLSGGYLFWKEKVISEETNRYQVGAYYQYTFGKFMGLETGLQYRRVDVYLMGSNLHNMGMIPLNIILFPHYRCNILGGLCGEYMFGKFSKRASEGLKKKFAVCYGVGLRFNWKYVKLRFQVNQSFAPWIKLKSKMISEDWEHPKDRSLVVGLEVPIWRSKKTK